MKQLLERYPQLESCREEIEKALLLMIDTYSNGGKILVCGNGGSAADSAHIVGELMKGFLLPRPVTDLRIPRDLKSRLQGALPAISLPSQSAVLTAYSNDVDPEMMYAQLVYGYAQKNDLVIGISTSGNSKNVVNAVAVANAIGIKSIAMTGRQQSKLSEISNVTIQVPADNTYQVQEYHLPVYHYLCAKLEEAFFGDGNSMALK